MTSLALHVRILQGFTSVLFRTNGRQTPVDRFFDLHCIFGNCVTNFGAHMKLFKLY